MTYQINTSEGAAQIQITFSGLLDRQALRAILARAEQAGRLGAKPVTLVLEAGTEVDGECLEPLRRLEGVTVCAVAPFLKHWLAQGATR